MDDYARTLPHNPYSKVTEPTLQASHLRGMHPTLIVSFLRPCPQHGGRRENGVSVSEEALEVSWPNAARRCIESAGVGLAVVAV